MPGSPRAQLSCWGPQSPHVRNGPTEWGAGERRGWGWVGTLLGLTGHQPQPLHWRPGQGQHLFRCTSAEQALTPVYPLRSLV